MPALLKVLAILLPVGSLLGYSGEFSEIVKTYSAKTGRVIDRDTGAGIADAAVIAQGQFSSGGAFQTSHGCVFAAIAYTAPDGSYRVPAAWSHLTPGAPYFDPHNYWSVVVLKPGYAEAGDADHPLDKIIHDPIPPFGPLGMPLETTWNGMSTHLDDIKLARVQLDMKEKTVYARRVGGCVQVNPDGFARLRKERFHELKADVCASDASVAIDSRTMLGLAEASTYLNGDARTVEQFNQRMAKADPAFNDILKSDNQVHDYHAGDVCAVMTAMETSP